MRIYNGTNSQLNLPLSSVQRISIAPKSVSGDLMPSNEFLSLLVSSFGYNEIALIVSGPYEISMCAGVSGSVGFVAQSLEEAIERFAEKKEVAPQEVEVEKEPVVETVKEEKEEEQVTVSFNNEENATETIEEEKATVEEEQPKKATKKVKKIK